MMVDVQHAFQPHRPRFVVVVFDAAARVGDLVRAHGRIAHENQLVVVGVLVQHVENRRSFAVAPAIVAPYRFIEEVVEVEVLQVLEFGARGREQFLAHFYVVFHRAAHVQEQQHLYRVVPLRHHLDVEPAGVPRGRADGVVQVQFLGRPLAGELAQAL
jgi:hypothetical protein